MGRFYNSLSAHEREERAPRSTEREANACMLELRRERHIYSESVRGAYITHGTLSQEEV